MAYFDCLMGGGNNAVITVTYDSTFYGKTITCTNGIDTYTDTTTSSGTTEFEVDSEGTWTISCNGVSRQVVVSFNYALQLSITKTITIHGAKEDYITFTDLTGGKVCQFGSGETSKSVNITFIPNNSITFTSTIAKNPNDLSQYYSKSIIMDENITDIYVMPENVIYWYGYIGNYNLRDMSTAEGWSLSRYSWAVPSWLTNKIVVNSTSNTACGVYTQVASAEFTKAKVIIHGTDDYTYGTYGWLRTNNTKNADTVVGNTDYAIVDEVAEVSITQGLVLFDFASVGRKHELYAMWYE